jgi:restriction endonuclease Mrr
MSSTEHKDLSVKEICEIITVGAKNGLATLKYAGLELTFKETHTPSMETPATVIVEPSQGPEEELAPISPEVLQKIEQDMKQEELSQMMINDPAQFEELISLGEIENDDENRGTESALPRV